MAGFNYRSNHYGIVKDGHEMWKIEYTTEEINKMGMYDDANQLSPSTDKNSNRAVISTRTKVEVEYDGGEEVVITNSTNASGYLHVTISELEDCLKAAKRLRKLRAKNQILGATAHLKAMIKENKKILED